MTPKGPPKSITVEDSFRQCCSIDGLLHVLQVLAPDLAQVNCAAKVHPIARLRPCCVISRRLIGCVALHRVESFFGVALS